MDSTLGQVLTEHKKMAQPEAALKLALTKEFPDKTTSDKILKYYSFYEDLKRIITNKVYEHYETGDVLIAISAYENSSATIDYVIPVELKDVIRVSSLHKDSFVVNIKDIYFEYLSNQFSSWAAAQGIKIAISAGPGVPDYFMRISENNS